MEQTGQEQEPIAERERVERAQRGDAAAFDALVRAYETPAFRAAYLYLRDEHEAADVAQEAFVRAHRALGSFRATEPFRPWLMRIVTNLALNRIEALKRRARMTDRYARAMNETNEPPNAQRALEAREQNDKLMRAVARLEPDEQALISLRYWMELPEQEVAYALNIPQGTVKSRLHRTLAKLREIIRKEFPDLAEFV